MDQENLDNYTHSMRLAYRALKGNISVQNLDIYDRDPDTTVLDFRYKGDQFFYIEEDPDDDGNYMYNLYVTKNETLYDSSKRAFTHERELFHKLDSARGFINYLNSKKHNQVKEASNAAKEEHFVLLREDVPRLEHLGFGDIDGTIWLWNSGDCSKTVIEINTETRDVTWYQGCELCNRLAVIIINDLLANDIIAYPEELNETVHHYPDEEHDGDTQVCPECGSEIDPSFHYCTRCRGFVTPVDKSYLEESNEDNETITEAAGDRYHSTRSVRYIAEELVEAMDLTVKEVYPGTSLWAPEEGLVWQVTEEVLETFTRLIAEHIEDMPCKDLARLLLSRADRIVKDNYFPDSLFVPGEPNERSDGLIWEAYPDILEAFENLLKYHKENTYNN